MASDLPPYSGRSGCPKCGTVMGTTWHVTCLHKDFPCYHVQPPRHFEHLCRVCPCCGYGRMEATADAGEATPGLHALPGGAEQ